MSRLFVSALALGVFCFGTSTANAQPLDINPFPTEKAGTLSSQGPVIEADQDFDEKRDMIEEYVREQEGEEPAAEPLYLEEKDYIDQYVERIERERMMEEAKARQEAEGIQEEVLRRQKAAEEQSRREAEEALKKEREASMTAREKQLMAREDSLRAREESLRDKELDLREKELIEREKALLAKEKSTTTIAASTAPAPASEGAVSLAPIGTVTPDDSALTPVPGEPQETVEVVAETNIEAGAAVIEPVMSAEERQAEEHRRAERAKYEQIKHYAEQFGVSLETAGAEDAVTEVDDGGMTPLAGEDAVVAEIEATSTLQQADRMAKPKLSLAESVGEDRPVISEPVTDEPVARHRAELERNELKVDSMAARREERTEVLVKHPQPRKLELNNARITLLPFGGSEEGYESLPVYDDELVALPVYRTGYKGELLEDVLRNWADREGVGFIWKTHQRYVLAKDVSYEQGFEASVESVLSQFTDVARRPVGALHTDTLTGVRTLSVSSE